MAIGNGNYARVFSKTLAYGNSNNEIRQDEEGKKRGVSMERSEYERKRSTDGLSLHNNKHNVVVFYVRNGKITMEFNQQKTKWT